MRTTHTDYFNAMTLDGLLAARAQFAFTIAFHILWPAYTIGISSFIAIVSALWLKTGRRVYHDLLRFWIHLFALGFAMGVVTGIVMSYEIGTNWSVFAHRTANVIGPFFAYEALLAFFLEAGFIGIMLFGMNRVAPVVHFFACLAVALGAMFSAFWILAANSWMHTPAGFALDPDGIFQVVSWWDAIFNPSFPYRFAHMVTAAYIAGMFVVVGVSGFYLWRRRHREFARTSLSIAMWILLVLVPAQIAIGDMHGLNTLEHQPVKVAAMEGDWETRAGQPLVLFAWPNETAERNDYEVAIPKLGSLILTHEWNGEVAGLKSVPPQERPPVPAVFFAFRTMVGIGLILLAIVLVGNLLRWHGRLYETRWFRCGLRVFEPAAVYRNPCRLDRDRDRTAALCRLRPAAHRRGGVAGCRRCRVRLAGAVRDGLFGPAARVLLLCMRLVMRGPDIREPAE